MEAKRHHQQTSQLWLFGILVASLLGVMAYLGGTPPDEQTLMFIIGVIVTIGGTLAIGLVGWHLLARPLPDGHKLIRQALLTGHSRYLAGLLMVLGFVNIVVASSWDEIWHSVYGIPFGEDFFWRPHQMMYFGFLVTIAVAAWSLWLVMTKGKGTLQQRFRMDPALGFAIMSGAYLAFALPADPIWHAIYGEDLTAWSLPHVILLTMITVMCLSAILMLLSGRVQKQLDWALFTKVTVIDLLLAIVFAGMLNDYVVVLTVEWYFGVEFSDVSSANPILSRPDWILPVIMGFVSAFCGGLVLLATRRIGLATAIGLIALSIRFAVEQFVGSTYTGIEVYAVIVPLLLTLDVTYYVYSQSAKRPNLLLMSAILTGVMGLVGVFAINNFFAFPTFTLANAPMMLVIVFIVSLVGLFMADVIGDYLVGVAPVEQKAQGGVKDRLWIDGIIYAGFALFAVFLMLTASPPA